MGHRLVVTSADKHPEGRGLRDGGEALQRIECDCGIKGVWLFPREIEAQREAFRAAGHVEEGADDG